MYRASSVLKKDGIHSPEPEKIAAASTTLAHEGGNGIYGSGRDNGGAQEGGSGIAATAAESNLEIIDDGVRTRLE